MGLGGGRSGIIADSIVKKIAAQKQNVTLAAAAGIVYGIGMPGVSHADNSIRGVDCHTLHRHSLEVVLCSKGTVHPCQNSSQMERLGSRDEFMEQVPNESSDKGALQTDAGRVTDGNHETVIGGYDLEKISGEFALGKDSSVNIQPSNRAYRRRDQFGAERFWPGLIRMDGFGKVQDVSADGLSQAFDQGYAPFDESRIVLLQLNAAPQLDIFQHRVPNAASLLRQKRLVNQIVQFLQNPRLEHITTQR